ncbi:MAG: DUF6431 domain-containing protein [Bacilli bacterium]|nr:DUF6431 domain-containing protein [Bacilli bacterium]
MISINSNKINPLIENSIRHNKVAVELINKNINIIKDFSNILQNINIIEFDKSLENHLEDDSALLYLLKSYEAFCQINDFNSLTCPCCKNKRCLSYHKTYNRNIVFYINNYKIEGLIALTVLICSICMKEDKQKYHALIPDFIFPYHAYSTDTIIKTLYNILIKKIKVSELIKSIQISHQLLYKWIKGLYTYSIPSSIVLQVKADVITIIECLYLLKSSFLLDYYQTFDHPFFLFKPTCVPLSVTP